jgi:hypothetical protein
VQVGGQAIANGGLFSISNYQDPVTGKRYGRLIQNGNAIGAYDLTVTLTDSEGTVATTTFQVVFGETPLTGSFAGAGQFFGGAIGEAVTMIWSGSTLNTNIAFANMSLQDQGFVAIPPAVAGMLPPAPGGSNAFTSTEKCADCNEGIVSCLGTTAAYRHSVYRFAAGSMAPFTQQAGIVEGTAYVTITLKANNENTYCSPINSGGGPSEDEGITGPGGGNAPYIYTFGSFNIDHKSPTATQWGPAVDLNGDYTGAISPSSVTANYSQGEWRKLVQSGTTTDFQYGQIEAQTNSFGGGNQNGSGMWEIRLATKSSGSATTVSCYASRTFAFDVPGDYRIVTNNINNNNWQCNDAICNNAGTNPSYSLGFGNGFDITFGDFYYDFGNQRAFKYRVGYRASTSNLIPSAGSVTVYAKEPFFRYITEFYSDPDLTQKNFSGGWPGSGAGNVNVRTVSSGGTNFSAAGNWNQKNATEYPFEFAGQKSSGNYPGSSNAQNQELREWQMQVNSNGVVTPGSQQPLLRPN